MSCSDLELQLIQIRKELSERGQLIDLVEKELAPLKKEFFELWKKKNQLEQKLFEQQGKIKVFRIGVSGRKQKSEGTKSILNIMTPKEAKALLEQLEAETKIARGEGK